MDLKYIYVLLHRQAPNVDAEKKARIKAAAQKKVAEARAKAQAQAQADKTRALKLLSQVSIAVVSLFGWNVVIWFLHG